MTKVVFTIISRNYAAQAAVLMGSVSVHEPSVRRVVFTTDGAIEHPGLVNVEQIAANSVLEEYTTMALYYTALELNTAVKPACFQHLLTDSTVDRAIYLDPDIQVYAALTPVWTALDDNDVVLTPHLLQPNGSDTEPNDQTILKSGAYNLGFLGLRATNDALRFVQWWTERCRFGARVAFAEGLFTDQKWMDLAPSFLNRCAILRHGGLNVAYWNVEPDALFYARSGWRVGDEPLIFFHFSGFNPHRPEIISKHQVRILPRPGSPLAQLLKDYARALLGQRFKEHAHIPYAFSRWSDGTPIIPTQRHALFEAARAGTAFQSFEAAANWLQSQFSAPAPDRSASGRNWFAGIEAWNGRAVDVWTWLQSYLDDTGHGLAVRALLQSRADLRLLSPSEGASPHLLAAVLGREAASRRFDPGLWPAGTTLTPAVAELATRSCWGSLSPPQGKAAQIAAAYGLNEIANWPEWLAAPLRDQLLSSLEGDALLGLGVSRAMATIWRWRADLQAEFSIMTLLARMRYLKWMHHIGQVEYGIRASVGSRKWARAWTKSLPLVTRQEASVLLVSTSGPRDQLRFDPAAHTFVINDNRLERPPGLIGTVVFEVDPRHLPADAIALRAQGVRWSRAVAAWGEDACQIAQAYPAALGFVDQVNGISRRISGLV